MAIAFLIVPKPVRGMVACKACVTECSRDERIRDTHACIRSLVPDGQPVECGFCGAAILSDMDEAFAADIPPGTLPN